MNAKGMGREDCLYVCACMCVYGEGGGWLGRWVGVDEYVWLFGWLCVRLYLYLYFTVWLSVCFPSSLVLEFPFNIQGRWEGFTHINHFERWGKALQLINVQSHYGCLPPFQFPVRVVLLIILQRCFPDNSSSEFAYRLRPLIHSAVHHCSAPLLNEKVSHHLKRSSFSLLNWKNDSVHRIFCPTSQWKS